MNVAICDDEPYFLKAMSDIIERYSFKANLDIYISAFTSTDELEKSISNFDIIFLDICFNGNNIGIEWAKRLRNSGDDTLIVICSSLHEQLAYGYEADAVRFLIKPITEESLAAAFAACLKRMEVLNRKLSIKTNRETVLINSSRIIYIESINRQREIVFINSSPIFTYETLKDIYNKIDSVQFVFVQKSFIVNLSYIDKISRADLVLVGGKNISVGRSFQDELRFRLVRFMGK